MDKLGHFSDIVPGRKIDVIIVGLGIRKVTFQWPCLRGSKLLAQ